MSVQQEIIQKIFQKGKGILAADERETTMNNRLHECGIEGTEYNRLIWRHILLSTPNIDHYISGIILSEDIISARTPEGGLFSDYFKENKNNIVCGLKVDSGVKQLFTGLQNEYYTEGLDTVSQKIAFGKSVGALFTKWRSVFYLGSGKPSDECIHRNIMDMVTYTKEVLNAGLVPILEPEVIREGTHSLKEMGETFNKILTKLIIEISKHSIDLCDILIKMAFVTRGREMDNTPSDLVGLATVDAIKRNLPSTLGGIVFLSGGLSEKYSNLYLQAVVNHNLTIPVSFSFGRSLQKEALRVWGGQEVNKKTSQKKLFDSCKNASIALS